MTLAPGAGATATGGGTDYSLGSSSLVIAAGSSTQTTTITSVDDNITEGNEAVVLDITESLVAELQKAEHLNK